MSQNAAPAETPQASPTPGSERSRRQLHPWERPVKPSHDAVVNWRDINGSPVEWKSEKMGEPDPQTEMIKIVCDRYRTMIPHNSDQALDVTSEWLIKQIVGENGLQLTEGLNETQLADEIEAFLPQLRIDRLHSDTRAMLYLTCQATLDEMYAAASYVARDISPKRFQTESGRGGLSGFLSYGLRTLAANVEDKTIQTLGRAVDDSRIIGGAVSLFFPSIPRNPKVRERWMQERKGRRMTAYDPVEQAYDSSYMKALGFDRVNPDDVRQVAERAQVIRNVEKYVVEFLEKDTGITINDPYFRVVAGMYATDEGGADTFSRNPLRQVYGQKLREVLADSYNRRRFQDIPVTERTSVRVQAAVDAMTFIAKDQAFGILYQTNENTYRERDVTKARGRLDAINADTLRSQAEIAAETLNTQLTQVNTAATELKTKQQERLGAQRGFDIANKTAQRNREDQSRASNEQLAQNISAWWNQVPPRVGQQPGRVEDAERAETAARNSATAIQRLDEEIREYNGRLQAADTAIQPILTRLQAQMNGFYTSAADQAEIGNIFARNALNLLTIDMGRLDAFLSRKTVEQSQAAGTGTTATTTERDTARARKTIGGNVLTFIQSDDRNEAIRRFATGEIRAMMRKGQIQNYAEFVRALGLDIDPRILPPERVAKLLITYMRVERDPNDIVDAAAANRIWPELRAQFARMTEFRQGQIASEMIFDRFMAIRDLGDVFADVQVYTRPEAVAEMERRRMAPEQYENVLEREGIHMGVDAIVENVGKYLLVGQDGEVTVYEVQELLNNERNLNRIADMNLRIVGGNVEVSPTVTPEARRVIFAEFARRAIIDRFMAQPVNVYTEDLVGADGTARRVRRTGPRLQDVVVETGPEVLAAGGPIPIERFADVSQQLDGEFQNQGGNLIINNLADRSADLADIAGFKRQGFAEQVDPRDVPDQIAWIDDADPNSEYAVILNDPANIYVEHRIFNPGPPAQWNPAGEFIAGVVGIAPRMTLDNFLALTDAQDQRALRARVATSAFDLFLRLSPEQRRFLNVGQIDVDLSVPGTIDDWVAIIVNDEGRPMVRAADGRQWPLSALLNTAVETNNLPAPLYNVIGANAPAIMPQENIRIQTAIGTEVLRRLGALRRIQP